MICTLLRKPLNGGGILNALPCGGMNIDATRVPVLSGTRSPRAPSNLLLKSDVTDTLDKVVGFMVGRGNRNPTFSAPGDSVIVWGLVSQPREALFDPGGYVSRFFKVVQ
jgi:hypothetical protein